MEEWYIQIPKPQLAINQHNILIVHKSVNGYQLYFIIYY